MNGYPPPVLVETWLYLIKDNDPELEQIKLPLRRVIKNLFGSAELAELYVEQFSNKEVDVQYI